MGSMLFLLVWRAGMSILSTGAPEMGVPVPEGLQAEGFDSHVELRWSPEGDAEVANFRIYRSTDQGASFQAVATVGREDTLFLDWVRPLGLELQLQYRLTALSGTGEESAPSETVQALTRVFSDEELLDMVQRYTLRYFWEFAHPFSGLIRERNTSGDVVTMGGTGFGIMALLAGVERGFLKREQVRDRLLNMVFFLERADRFRGVYPHWMNGRTGRTVPFSQRDDGGDLVETAFLFQGLLTARQYFDSQQEDEVLLREKITQLYREINWNWYRKQFENVLYWHWSPNFQFAINLPVRGWNETSMVYLLAIASPTQGVPPSLWDKGWASDGAIRYGISHYGYRLPLGGQLGGPLFFTHYSFLGFDPRFKRDKYANYWVQNRNQSLINQAYCIENPRKHAGYSAVSWGITASDDPGGYLAHAPGENTDNGTIAPTGALSSMPYTPEESMAALRHFYRELGDRLWGPMGFYDAFNIGRNWFARSYLAIDQGPIVVMIENHRSELLWRLFMSNPEIQNALDAIGFQPDSIPTSTRITGRKPDAVKLSAHPNPASGPVQVNLDLREGARLMIELIDSGGKVLQSVSQDQYWPAGNHLITIPPRPPGLYLLRVRQGNHATFQKLIFQ